MTIDENDPVIQQTLKEAEWAQFQRDTNTHPCFKELFTKYGQDIYVLAQTLSKSNQCHFILKELAHKHQSRHGIEAVDFWARKMAELISYRLESLNVEMKVLIDCMNEGQKIAQENDKGQVPVAERRIIVPH